MQDLVRAAMRDGAIGFTSSQLELHVAHDGRGVPSNHASPDELVALDGRAGRVRPGLDRVHPPHVPRRLRRRRPRPGAARWPARPAGRCTSTRSPRCRTRPTGGGAASSSRRRPAADGLEMHPMFAANRQGAHFALGSTFLFDEMPSFRDTLTLPSPARERRLRDPAVRDQMRAELADPRGRSFVFVWEVVARRVGRTARARTLPRPQPCRRSPTSSASIRSTPSSTSRSPRTSRRSSCSPRRRRRPGAPRSRR